MLMARLRIVRDGLQFSLKNCLTIISVAMKLHNFCIGEDAERGRRGWEGVYRSIYPGELAALEADQGRYVRELRRCNREAIETFGPRRHVSHRTRRGGHTLVRSERREALKDIVAEKGLIRPNSSLPFTLTHNFR